MAKTPKANTLISTLDVPLRSTEALPDDSIILVLGETGAGRSTFINYALGRDEASIGHGLNPETGSISSFYRGHPNNPRRRFIFVDTPGFDTAVWNHTIIQRLVTWLKLSLPPKARRKLAIVYLLDISLHFSPQNTGQKQLRTWCNRMAKRFVVATTKWREVASEELGRQRKQSISDACGRSIYAFGDTHASAWEIINAIPDSPIDISDFLFDLADVRHVKELRPRNSSSRSWSLPPLGRRRKDVNMIDARLTRGSPRSTSPSPLCTPPDVLPTVSVVEEFEEISARLMTVFGDEDEYKRLLSCRGQEAQAVLDMFQTILRMGPPLVDHHRQNIIVATKRLSSKTDLYPRQFFLKGVTKVDEYAVDSGGFADIYKGRLQGETVCLKVIRVHKNKSYERILKAIAREAILWGQMSHPNLLPFYGIHRSGTQLWLVSPWAGNGNVIAFLKSNPTVNRIQLCADIAEGVAYLHQNNIVHGDLKGENVVVDGSFRAYVTDFGLSAVEDAEILYWASQSKATSVGGTARWQAPELFEYESTENSQGGPEENSMHPNTQATDVYAWGCICYEVELLPFFQYPNQMIMLRFRDGTTPTLPTALNSECASRGLTEDIWVLMNDCWLRDPAKRPAIRQALSRLMAHQPDDHRSPGEWQAGPATRKRGLDDSDFPLTLNSLNAIIARELPGIGT